MKKVISYIYTRPIKVLFFLIAIILIPIMSVLHPQSQDVSIIRTLGIDKLEDGFEISMVSYEPASTQSFKENYILVSAKGQTISESLKLAADYLGKRIGLAHLNNIVVSNQIAQENLASFLDYLCRSYSLNNATNVINTNVSAKEFLKLNLKIQSKNSNQESNFVEHNVGFVNGSNTDLEDVIVSAYSPNKTALINIIKIDENAGLDLTGESETSAESSGGNDSSSNKEQQAKFLKNDGSVAVIVDGKKQGELNRDETSALCWINKNFTNNYVVLNDYSKTNFENAKITLKTTSKAVKLSCHFEDQKPVILADININLEVVEAIQNNKTIKMYTPNNEMVNCKMMCFAGEEIKQKFYDVWQKIKDMNADPYDFYQLLNTKNTKEFKKFLSELENKEEYIKNIEVIVNINCSGC